MRILVLVADYPNNKGGVSLMYTHVRNKYYVEAGIDVTVLNFKATEDYIIDGVKVISLKTYKKSSYKKYDILVSHAANLRNHYLFMKKYERNFTRFVFFFHGHEVLRIKKVYSQPYEYMKKMSPIKDLYDIFKLNVWHYYYLKLLEKGNTFFIFVSNWMKDEFIKWCNIGEEKIAGKYQIIYNSVANVFQEKVYDVTAPKLYDFVTIRGNIDGSKYCVDIVNNLAKNNPKYKFLLYGKGEFFRHYSRADNLTWFNETLLHEEMIDVLNSARCALMPTRTDSQGVMMCEMATFGIPVITSNISVCHEIFDGENNIFFIDNEDADINLSDLLDCKYTKNMYKKNTAYFANNTLKKELELFYLIID